MFRTSWSLLLVAQAALSLPAQTFQPLPAHADLADGLHSLALPFGGPGFRTQILVDAASIAPTGAVLNSIGWRADRYLGPVGSRQVPNVTVRLSHTSTALGAMSETFASNITGAVTTVFQGTVS